PLPSTPSPLGLVCILRGKIKYKTAWGSPLNPYQTLIRACRCMGGCFGAGGLPPKAPCPHVDGDKGLFLTTLVGGCGGLRVGGLSESGSPL
ncbi:unnamed protein product, partial [Staurois parvus]